MGITFIVHALLQMQLRPQNAMTQQGSEHHGHRIVLFLLFMFLVAVERDSMTHATYWTVREAGAGARGDPTKCRVSYRWNLKDKDIHLKLFTWQDHVQI